MGDFHQSVTPLKEQEQDEDVYSNSGCGCFKFFSFKSQNKHLLQHKGEHVKAFLAKGAKKVKQVSEVLGGPKWKNFIRKVPGYCNNRRQKNKFQYDPQSYALNFDSGREDEDSLLH